MMELYPHNQRAYDNAVFIFQELDRTCIIHPTGTGKNVIISEFIVRHRGASHLLLAPGHHMFDEVRKYSGSRTFKGVTYHGITDRFLESCPLYDFIYLDEFHRIGAEQWGPAVSRLLALNPAAKVIGTSATHIRYLDDARDMAKEIFGGSVASFISLNKAIAQGILRAPKYVSAIYSIEVEYRALAAKLKASNYLEKKVLAEKLKQNVIDWGNTSGLWAVFKRHIPKDRKGIIVFCQTLEEMREVERVLMPILMDIFGEVSAFRVHSRQDRRGNMEAFRAFRERDGKAKVMFCVNKANEGLHGKDISVCVLMRETTSPNVFYQQIGRCFSADQEVQPVILDLVNNFSNIQIERFRREFDTELEYWVDPVLDSRTGSQKLGSAKIEFIDETKGIREVFSLLEFPLDNWECLFARAAEFYEKNRHL